MELVISCKKLLDYICIHNIAEKYSFTSSLFFKFANFSMSFKNHIFHFILFISKEINYIKLFLS